MAERRPRRVLVAVAPHLLGTALAQVLEREGADVDVIDLRDPASRPEEERPETTAPSGHYDAAIVTVTLPEDADADVVIHLPDPEIDLGAEVERGDDIEVVEVRSLEDLHALLGQRLGSPGEGQGNSGEPGGGHNPGSGHARETGARLPRLGDEEARILDITLKRLQDAAGAPDDKGGSESP